MPDLYPWLIGASIITLIIFALLSVLLVRDRAAKKQLEKLVKQRTDELELQTSRLKTMEEEAQAASQDKSAFLAKMSHELRTPLNVITGLTDLILEENNLPHNVSENLHKISNAGSALLDIVNGNIPMGPALTENLREFRYEEEKRTVTKKLERPDLSFARVLVVDDMQTNLDVASGLLGKYKMQIDCVLSGEEAYERMRSGGTPGSPVYNAIFMDHMMPGMDGIETADLIRGLGTEYARKIPMIALTANAAQTTEALFYAHDFQAFLTKPVDIIQLDSIIRKWIRPPDTDAKDFYAEKQTN